VGALYINSILDDSLRPERLLALSPDTLLVGGSTEGHMEIRVHNAGYLPWAGAADARLTSGECPSWQTQLVVANLQHSR
jgi:hypothetical protein